MGCYLAVGELRRTLFDLSLFRAQAEVHGTSKYEAFRIDYRERGPRSCFGAVGPVVTTAERLLSPVTGPRADTGSIGKVHLSY